MRVAEPLKQRVENVMSMCSVLKLKTVVIGVRLIRLRKGIDGDSVELVSFGATILLYKSKRNRVLYPVGPCEV